MSYTPIPQTSRKPIIGNAIDLFKDPVAFALREYHDKGPIFEAKIFNKKVYFAAGLFKPFPSLAKSIIRYTHGTSF